MSNVELGETWSKLEQGVDQIMNHLEQGMSYQKYMDWYTYVDHLALKQHRLIYNYCTSTRVMTGYADSGSMSSSVSRGMFLCAHPRREFDGR